MCVMVKKRFKAQKNNVAWSKNCFERSVRVNKYHGRACTNHRLDYVSHLLKQENLQMPPRNSTLVGDENGLGKPSQIS